MSIIDRAAFHRGLIGRTVRRTIVRGMQEHPELASPAGGVPEVRLVGLDPVRVLIMGAGLAVGYGVATHEDALTGGLAEVVQNGGTRGVVVQNTATALQGVEQSVVRLGMVGATSFHIIVWCPSLFDVFRNPESGRYQRKLIEGLALVRATARPGARIRVCELPLPTSRGPIEEIARTYVPRFNAALRRAIATYPGTAVAETPPFTSLLDPGAFSPDYYRTWAQWIIQAESVHRA